MPKVDWTDELFRRISLQDDEEAFRLLFYDFFAPLCVFAHRYIDEPESCEDIVQETFYRIWKNRKSLCIGTSARNFLLTSVRNSCLDGLRRKATEMRWSEYMQDLSPTRALHYSRVGASVECRIRQIAGGDSFDFPPESLRGEDLCRDSQGKTAFHQDY